MTDLAAFLAARLGEDEAAAKEAEGHPVFDGTGIVITHDRTAVIPSHAAAHIARHDPDRVLREVAAKRAILALHERVHTTATIEDPEEHGYCAADGEWWPCGTLNALAAVWDSPEFFPDAEDGPHPALPDAARRTRASAGATPAARRDPRRGTRANRRRCCR